MTFQTQLRKVAVEIEDIFADVEDREERFERLLSALAEVWENGREDGYEDGADEMDGCDDCSDEYDRGYEDGREIGLQEARDGWN